MLVTTCPECETTFRISVGILEKAGGQVRCGRCAKIFDANVELREIDDAEAAPSTGPKFRFGLEAGPETPPAADGIVATDDDTDPDDNTYADADADRNAEGRLEAEPDSPAGNAELEAAGVAGLPDPAEPVDPGTRDNSDGAIHATGSADGRFKASAASALLPEWLRPVEQPDQRQASRWIVGAALLGVILAVQLVHRFRNELVSVPLFGAVLERVYSVAGTELVAPVDLDQFDLLDLTALAEPAVEEQGCLIIETRVRNKGPKVQPYPHIFVRLLDRWEDTVAGRYFAPNEYTVSAIADYSRMNSGTTIDAQFIIMDPGPSATGFELELCAAIAQGFMCESGTNFR